MKIWSTSRTTLKATIIFVLTVFYAVILVDVLPFGILRMVSIPTAEKYHQFISDNNIHIIIGIIMFIFKIKQMKEANKKGST